ncbi:MAG: copper chaperone PCu(A)C [Burkholderiales bacterium]|jgi:copper(I)-binding protein|nr:copper chaperone PCu(A)C [Burkholderiales bacterium]
MLSILSGQKPYGLLLLALLCAAQTQVQAQAQNVTVKDAWIRGTVQGQTATGAFMELTAKTNARLIGVSTPLTKAAEVHNMKMENGVMKMFPVDGIDVPAGKTLRLASGGYHVMLMNLQKPLNPGDKVPLQLTFELADKPENKKRETVDLMVEVRDIKGRPAAHQHKH